MAKMLPLVNISVLIRGVHLDPDEISVLLNVDYDYGQKTGEVFISKGSREITRKIGVWSFDDQSEISNVCHKTKTVLSNFANINISKLPNVDESILDIFILISKNNILNVDFDFNFDQDILEKINILGLCLKITFGVTKE